MLIVDSEEDEDEEEDEEVAVSPSKHAKQYLKTNLLTTIKI
jgi:hypothetical protein